MLDQDFIVCVHANWLILNFNKLYENFHTAIKKKENWSKMWAFTISLYGYQMENHWLQDSREPVKKKPAIKPHYRDLKYVTMIHDYADHTTSSRL